MQLIPVIDLLAGQVVRGIGGQRSQYRPIESALCKSSLPAIVAPRLLDYTGSDILYVADLDALGGGGIQLDLLVGLLQQEARLRLWLDAGFADAAAFAWLQDRLGALAARVVPVFASEALASREAAHEALSSFNNCILSLDRHGGEKLDPSGCLDAPQLWPSRLIVMNLLRVGSRQGPDVAAVAQVRGLAPQAQVIGAGGIDSDADLAQAAASGAAAWLVASAVHDLRIGRTPAPQ